MSDELSWDEMRRRVAERARGCCEYCRSQARFAPDPFAVDHITPSSQGGADSLDNLAFACFGCNGHKSDRVYGVDPVTKKVVSLYHPRRQRWRDHFTWSPDSSHIVGLTPTGRATVEMLYLNREGVVNLRRVLILMEEHPPPETESIHPAPTSNGTPPE